MCVYVQALKNKERQTKTHISPFVMRYHQLKAEHVSNCLHTNFYLHQKKAISTLWIVYLTRYLAFFGYQLCSETVSFSQENLMRSIWIAFIVYCGLDFGYCLALHSTKADLWDIPNFQELNLTWYGLLKKNHTISSIHGIKSHSFENWELTTKKKSNRFVKSRTETSTYLVFFLLFSRSCLSLYILKIRIHSQRQWFQTKRNEIERSQVCYTIHVNG